MSNMRSYVYFGWAHYRLNQFEKSIQCLKNSLEIASKTIPTTKIFGVNILIGNCYSKLGKINEAFQTYKDSLD